MADTHPNAYRTEIDAKRKAASNLNAEADVLQAQLYELTGDEADNPTPEEVKPKKAKKEES